MSGPGRTCSLEAADRGWHPLTRVLNRDTLNRCLETAQITFQGLAIPGTDPFKPIIKEVCLISISTAERILSNRASSSVRQWVSIPVTVARQLRK